MISKANILELINEYVIFEGFTDQNEFINGNLNSRTDWNGNEFLYKKENDRFLCPYNGKQCKIIGQYHDGSIECEFEQHDFSGNVIENHPPVIIAFEFSEFSGGLIAYDPIFNRVEQQDVVPINNHEYINQLYDNIQNNNNNIIENNIIENNII